MPTGVLLALLAYSLWAIGDGIIKGFSGSAMSVFEINFLINIFAIVALPFARQPGDRWADIFKLKHPLLIHLRALLYTGATLAFLFAVTEIQFAETYSLVFLAPLFLTLLSLLVLKENVGALRWILTVLSFAGVLIVVRPGFAELGLGHLAAIGCALCAAGGNVVLRAISSSERKERQFSIIAVNLIYQLAAAGILMIGSFVWPTPQQLLLLAIVGLLGGAAQILVIRAMQRTPASHFGPTQYVQILWGVVLGALFFDEHQDLVGYAGLVLLVAAGVATIFSDGAQARIAGRWTEFRARRGVPETNRVDGPEG